MSDRPTPAAAPARDPFDWLGRDPRALRGDMRTIRKAVRAGWIKDPLRRQQLLDAMHRLDIDALTPREFMQYVKIYTDMDAANSRDEDAKLKELIEARRREKERRPRVVIVQDMEAWHRERASDDDSKPDC
jgi:hypothetical protein